MKIKFNLYERVAGLFVLAAIVGSIVTVIGVAVKKGWFETKAHMQTVLHTAEGVRIGTQVQMAGLRAGAVTGVELRTNNEVLVSFEISEKFHDKVKGDSVVRVIRPFIIGEKVLDVSVGAPEAKRVAQHSVLPSEATADIMDLVSGRTLGPHLETMGKMSENLKYVADAFLDPKRTQEIVKIFDELAPLVKNMNGMAREVTVLMQDVNKNQKTKLFKMVDNLSVMTEQAARVMPKLTTELEKLLPVIAKDSPQLASDLSKIARNMAVLTDELQKTLPALQDIGPELPRASRRAIEALDETVVTLKALQKSFMLRGNVEDVREEEAKRERAPASDKEKKN